MKFNSQIFSKLLTVAFVIAATAFTMSCKNDDDDNNENITLTGQSKTYTLNSVSDPDISGTVKFAERSNHTTLVTINLDGTTSGNSYPAHIHANSAAETGGIIIDLNNVDGSSGKSETIIFKKNDGTAITYSDLIVMDGYVNVHKSSTELTTLVAQGDIGGNEMTSTFKTYTLSSVNDSGIAGTATFTKRANGNTLVMVNLTGASPSVNYPVYIYDNNFATTGPIAINLNNVNGTTGTSYTNIKQLNAGTAITYDQLASYNGYIGVTTSDITPTYVAQANIGSNSNN